MKPKCEKCGFNYDARYEHECPSPHLLALWRDHHMTPTERAQRDAARERAIDEFKQKRGEGSHE